jgi:hypothetical protein
MPTLDVIYVQIQTYPYRKKMDDESAEIELVCYLLTWYYIHNVQIFLQLEQNLNKTRQISQRMTGESHSWLRSITIQLFTSHPYKF